MSDERLDHENDSQDVQVGADGVASLGETPASRRSALRFAAAAAAGMAAPLVFGQKPAEAADGDELVIGQINLGTADSTDDTVLIHDNHFIVKDYDGTGYESDATDLPDYTVLGRTLAVLQGWGPESAKGVMGYGQGAGGGVIGYSETGWGIIGHTLNGIDVQARGTGRLNQVSNFTHTGSPPAFTPTSFEMVRDNDGVIWASGNADTGGTWRRLNSFIPIAPVRAWDSREASGNVPGGTTGLLTNGATRTLTITSLSAIPTDAAGVTCVFTAVNPTHQGRITVWPTGATEPTTSAGNWNAGAAVTNFYPSAGLGQTGGNKGKLTVKSIISGGGNTHMVLDITGYFV